jgi:hypothetical protein
VPVYVTTGKTYDESRNTSRVKPPPKGYGLEVAAYLRSRSHEPWYRWIVNRQNGVHDHAAVRSDGTRAACPVVGCMEALAP